MAEEIIFSKIIHKEIPADVVYWDDLVTAFRDNNPQESAHVGQEVYHIHLHLVGGRPLGPMLTRPA